MTDFSVTHMNGLDLEWVRRMQERMWHVLEEIGRAVTAALRRVAEFFRSVFQEAGMKYETLNKVVAQFNACSSRSGSWRSTSSRPVMADFSVTHMNGGLATEWVRARLDKRLVRIDSLEPGARVLTAYDGEQVLDAKVRWPRYGVRTIAGKDYAGCAEVLVR